MRRTTRNGLGGAALALAWAAAAVPGAATAQAFIPEPRAEDVASVDAIIEALYASISGGVGEERDYRRFRSLFAEGATLIGSGRSPAGEVGWRTMSPEMYWVNNIRSLMDIGFHENEIGRTREDFGNVTHVMSAYESLRRDETEPFSRGINSIHLIHDGSRWWVLNIFWDSERADNPIPARYLGG